jgi:hypothetical protein
MKTESITLYCSPVSQSAIAAFEEALYTSLMHYSLRHLPSADNNPIVQEHVLEALWHCLNVCSKAGMNTNRHFKKMYVFDCTTATLSIDWRMSRSGLNLMMMSIATVDEGAARWAWELANEG